MGDCTLRGREREHIAWMAFRDGLRNVYLIGIEGMEVLRDTL